MQCDASVERIADHVVKVEAAQSISLGKSIWMKNDKHAKLLGLCPEGREIRVGKLAAIHIGQYLHSLEAQLFHATF